MTFVVLLSAVIGTARADTSTLISIHAPRGAIQAFILIKPEKPVASVILFAGGHGALGLADTTSMTWGAGNFLVRSRDKFAAHDLMVAVADAPSDKGQGMNAIFRMSRAHADDIGGDRRLSQEAGKRSGMAGRHQHGHVLRCGRRHCRKRHRWGVVLTSTITRAKPNWKIAASHPDGVASMALPGVAVPALIVSHRQDGCGMTRVADSPKLTGRLTNARKVEVVLLDGGDPPRSNPCGARSQHGFLGIEGAAVSTIARFIKPMPK